MQILVPYSLKGLTLKNRIVMAPMASNLATERGYPSPRSLAHYQERARGGVGLVIVEATLISRQPPVSDGRLGLWSDDTVGPLSELAAAIREGGAVPAIQVADLSLRASGRKPADLTEDEIKTIREGYVRAVKRAVQAGFAAVEFHGAHSTTLADFLSQRGNRRTDAHGRGVGGRARLLTEIVTDVRGAIGQDYPLFCRINADEFTLNGNTPKQTIPLAQSLLRAGVDVLHVSAGGRPEDEGYSQARSIPPAWMPNGVNVYLAAEVKRATEAPVIAVGKLGDPAAAEAVLASGSADLVALARPVLADPDWVRKVEAGRQLAIKRCTCCGRCSELFREKEAVHCVTYAES